MLTVLRAIPFKVTAISVKSRNSTATTAVGLHNHPFMFPWAVESSPLQFLAPA